MQLNKAIRAAKSVGMSVCDHPTNPELLVFKCDTMVVHRHLKRKREVSPAFASKLRKTRAERAPLRKRLEACSDSELHDVVTAANEDRAALGDHATWLVRSGALEWERMVQLEQDRRRAELGQAAADERLRAEADQADRDRADREAAEQLER